MGLLVRILGVIKRGFSRTGGVFSSIRTKIGEIFETVFGASKILIQLSFIVQGIMGLVSTVITVIMVYLNFNTIKDLLLGIREDSSTWLDKIVNLFSQYPTFNSLIADMDTQMTSLSGSYFSPAVTFTSILQTFGIGDAVNTIITCALQGIAFVISTRLMMWSFSRIRLSITKPLG